MLPYSAAHSKALGGGRAFKPSRHKSWTTHPREITKNSASFASSKRSTPERGMASARQSLCGATRRIRSIIARNVHWRSMIWGRQSRIWNTLSPVMRNSTTIALPAYWPTRMRVRDELSRQRIQFSTTPETLYNYARFLKLQNRHEQAREWAQKLLAKKRTLPRYMQRIERPWFRKGTALVKELAASGPRE